MSIRRPKNLNPNPLFEIKSKQAYSLAHSARCKLNMSARDPDRNLRFMLGHAFLLDKALYRVAQVDEDIDDPEDNTQEQLLSDALGENETEGIDGDTEGQSGNLAGGKVKFDDTDGEEEEEEEDGWKKGGHGTDGKKEKVPDGDRTPSDYGSDEEDGGALGLTRFVSAAQQAPRVAAVEEREVKVDEEEVEDDEDDGFGLTRFGSASQAPPRMIPDEGEDDEEDELVSPPALPADLDLGAVIAGPESEEMGDLYERIRGCPCHGLGGKAEKGTKFWEIKDSTGPVGKPGKRMAIIQVEA